MGFLDSLTWQLLGGSRSQIALYDAVMNVISRHPRGLAGVVDQFHAAGLGQLVTSWVGNGTNLPATASQISKALGAEAMNDLARSTGLSDEDAAAQLARLLPRIIDALTPHGSMPTEATMLNRMTFLSGLLT
jgi:uncharacterized protein YidB (DUF937 family)